MTTITTAHGILVLPSLKPYHTTAIRQECFHGVSLFTDCEWCEWCEGYSPRVGTMSSDVLGECDNCHEDVKLDSTLYKQPFGRGYFCRTCDEELNSELRADACMGGRQ